MRSIGAEFRGLAQGLALASCAGALVIGCSGQISEPGGTFIEDSPGARNPDRRNPDGPADPNDPLGDDGRGNINDIVDEAICDDSTPPDVPTTSLRRLTRDQYDRTIEHLVGDNSGPARSFPADDDAEGFHVGGTATPLLIEQLTAASEVIAERASMDVVALVGCGASDANCPDTFIETFGMRAWRRPLTTPERTRLRAIYDTGAEDGFRNGIKLTMEALLQSPHFIYHVETARPDATSGAVVEVADYALANRLSYFLWASMPDDELLRAAGAGELRTEAGVRAQAERMLADAKAVGGFRSFYRQWLHLGPMGELEKVPGTAMWSDQVRADLQASLEAQMDSIFVDSPDVTSMYTGTTVYVNRQIAPLFGLNANDYGPQLEPVDLGASPQRAGFLTHPALMALLAKPDQSDPIHRAKFVRESLLCQHLPTPPDNIVIMAPEVAPGLSTRERFAEHSSNPTCAGCHRLLDPVGFGFEHYDAVGAWRDTDQGVPVDASGEMFETLDADGPFYGAVELVGKLAASQEAQRCVARQLFRFALQRVENTADACSLRHVFDEFETSGLNLHQLMMAIVTSDAFRFQRVQ